MPEKIDPWGSGQITDYEHVFKEFGLKAITDDLKLDHPVFERNIAVAHRDFNIIKDRIDKGKPFINMTGIASSGNFHLGHKLVIDIFKMFKDRKAKNYFGACDIDAYVSRPGITSMQQAKEYAVDNIADALALGLEVDDIYVQSKKDTRYYEFTFEVSKKITENMFRAIYGHLDMGKMSAVLLQIADILHGQLEEYSGKMPSVTAVGIDQDPHMRLTRDLAQRMPYSMFTPSSIYIVHQSGLKEGKKMSSSEPDTAIFLKDPPKEAEKKIMRAFTGGRETIAEQREKGGVPEVCKVYEILRYHDPDSKNLKRIYSECKSGKWVCGECKKYCAQFVKGFLENHQAEKKDLIEEAKKIVYG